MAETVDSTIIVNAVVLRDVLIEKTLIHTAINLIRYCFAVYYKFF